MLGLLLSPQGLGYLRGERDPHWLAELSAPVLITHVLLLHNMSMEWAPRLNQALWSVATEWQIYFALPFVLLPVWRRAGVWALAAAGMALGVAPVGLVLLASPFIPEAA